MVPEWGRPITSNRRAQLLRSPDPALEELLTELRLEVFLPADEATAEILRRRWE